MMEDMTIDFFDTFLCEIWRLFPGARMSGHVNTTLYFIRDELTQSCER